MILFTSVFIRRVTMLVIQPFGSQLGPMSGCISDLDRSTFAFIFFFLPETKDRTLEDINEMFQNHVGVRMFKIYECGFLSVNVGLTIKPVEAFREA